MLQIFLLSTQTQYPHSESNFLSASSEAGGSLYPIYQLMTFEKGHKPVKKAEVKETVKKANFFGDKEGNKSNSESMFG